MCVCVEGGGYVITHFADTQSSARETRNAQSLHWMLVGWLFQV